MLTQMPNGTFAEAVQVGPPPRMSGIDHGCNRFYAPGSETRDRSGNRRRHGRNDLVFWNKDHFEVHLQEHGGAFAAAPMRFACEVPFDSDDLFSLATGAMQGRILTT